MNRNIHRIREIYNYLILKGNDGDGDVFPDIEEVREVVDDKIFVNVFLGDLERKRLLDQLCATFMKDLFLFLENNGIFLESDESYGLSGIDGKVIASLYGQRKTEISKKHGLELPPLSFFLDQLQAHQSTNQSMILKKELHEQKKKLMSEMSARTRALSTQEALMQEEWEQKEAELKRQLKISKAKEKKIKNMMEGLSKSNKSRIERTKDEIKKVKAERDALLEKAAKLQQEMESLKYNTLTDYQQSDTLELKNANLEKLLDETNRKKAELEKIVDAQGREHEQQIKQLNEAIEVEKEKIKSGFKRLELQKKKMETERGEFEAFYKDQIESLEACNKTLLAQNKELHEQILSGIKAESDESLNNVHVIAIDLNNIYASLNNKGKKKGLRLFNIEKVFSQIYAFFIEKNNEDKLFNIMGRVFHSRHLGKWKPALEKTKKKGVRSFVKMFEWIETSYKKGVMESGKTKYQDVDTLLNFEIGKLLERHKGAIADLYIGSGDVDMIHLANEAKDNAIPIYVMSCQESLSREMKKIADDVLLFY